MNILVHAWRLVRREPRRAAASALGVTIASALLMSIVLFGTASGTTVSRRALAALPMDAQAVLAPGADAGAVASLVTSDPACHGQRRLRPRSLRRGEPHDGDGRHPDERRRAGRHRSGIL